MENNYLKIVFQRIQNKKKFLKNFLIKEWEKYKIHVNKLILIV